MTKKKKYCILLLSLFAPGIFVYLARPVRSQSGVKPVELAVGGGHACARMSNGTVRCWGDGTIGQLGNGAMKSSNRPVNVTGIHDAVSVIAGGLYSCALLSSGKIKCWGITEFGMLGKKMSGPEKCPISKSNYFPCTTKPMLVENVSSAVKLDGAFGRYCALLSSGKIKCWGGLNDYDDPPLENVVSVSSGQAHSCALLSNGEVHCWGAEEYCGLGKEVCAEGLLSYDAACAYNGKTVYLKYSDAKKVCALAEAGNEKCHVNDGQGEPWLCCPGETTVNDAGEETTEYLCGRLYESTYDCRNVMQMRIPDVWKHPAKNLVNIKRVRAGDHGSFAVTEDGRVFFWGMYEVYQIPNAKRYLPEGTDNILAFEPFEIKELKSVADISGSQWGGCAVIEGGKIQCWGRNGSGTLGIGKAGGAASNPAYVTGITNAISVGVSSSHACALLSDGTVKCWGSNKYDHKLFGYLGDGTNKDFSAVPVTVVGLK